MTSQTARQLARALPFAAGALIFAAVAADLGRAPIAFVGLVATALALLGQRLGARAGAAEIDAVTEAVRALRGGATPSPPRGRIRRTLHEELVLLASELRRAETTRRQSSDVLRLAVEESPSAAVLMASNGRIILANARARELFFDGVDLTGKNFLGMLARAPEALKRAMIADGDELLTIEDADGEPLTFHLAKRRLTLDSEPVVLVTVNDLTRELGRHEIEVWKQVIRVIAHEVNNSLAPISSLVSTGRIVAKGAPGEEKLERVFATVKERAEHLRDFLDGYARFARLPKPNMQEVLLADLARRIEELWPGVRIEGDLDVSPGWFDPAQIEQLLLNLLKNAGESGSPPEEIVLSIEAKSARWLRLAVKDRGHGMPLDVMKRALVPLFSTKANGNGLGLALCREIAEAHGGTLRLEAREGGGLEVSVKLRRRAATDPERPTALTLSRGG